MNGQHAREVGPQETDLPLAAAAVDATGQVVPLGFIEGQVMVGQCDPVEHCQ